MPATTKPFDCVEMKNQIQAEVLREFKGLGADGIRERIQRELMTSDDHLSKWWRGEGGTEEEVLAQATLRKMRAVAAAQKKARKAKSFDCLEMKNQVQSQLATERKGL